MTKQRIKVRKLKVCGKIYKLIHTVESIYGKAMLYRIEKEYTEWILINVRTKKNPYGEHVFIKYDWLCQFMKPQLSKKLK